MIIDTEYLKQYEELNDPDFLKTIFDRFRDAAPLKIQAIEVALEQENQEKIFFEAHALKNISGNLGAKELSQLCFEIESLTRDNYDKIEKIRSSDKKMNGDDLNSHSTVQLNKNANWKKISDLVKQLKLNFDRTIKECDRLGF